MATYSALAQRHRKGTVFVLETGGGDIRALKRNLLIVLPLYFESKLGRLEFLRIKTTTPHFDQLMDALSDELIRRQFAYLGFKDVSREMMPIVFKGYDGRRDEDLADLLGSIRFAAKIKKGTGDKAKLMMGRIWADVRETTGANARDEEYYRQQPNSVVGVRG